MHDDMFYFELPIMHNVIRKTNPHKISVTLCEKEKLNLVSSIYTPDFFLSSLFFRWANKRQTEQ